MSTPLFLVIAAVIIAIHAYVCSIASDIAHEKGFDKTTWFHRCFWLGPLMLILVAGLPDVHARSNQVEIYKQLKILVQEKN